MKHAGVAAGPGANLRTRLAAFISGPMAHQHADHEGDLLIAAARKVLSDAGEQWTRMRAEVYKVLVSLNRAASAYEIAEKLSEREERRVPANSVYRILDIFVQTNLVRRVESANAFIVVAHPECHHDCAFLICDKCSSVTHVDDDKLASRFRTIAKKTGFSPDRPVIEMHGRCRDCS